MVTAWEGGGEEGGVEVKLDCNESYFNADEVELLANRFRHVLRVALRSPDVELGLADVMPEEEREQLMRAFNATAAEYPREALIHELFEAQAAQRPEAVAAVYERQSLSYGELNARANQVAHRLIELGVKPDDRVAICVERSLEMVVGLLGILKAGGAYVPLDPAYPAERLAYMLEDSAPVALLTQEVLEDYLPARGVPTLSLDAHYSRALFAAQPTSSPEVSGLTSRHLAYVIYTSGSTGTPKGVMVQHENVVSFIAGHIRLCKLDHSDRVLQFASFGFDSSVAEMMPTLAAGATIVLRPEHLSPDQLSGFLEAQQISVVDLPTAFWSAWSRQVSGSSALSIGSALRLVIVSGEAVDLRHLQLWKDNPNTRLCRWLNNYGPTETTVNATAFALECFTEDFANRSVPIGRPIDNAKIYILSVCGAPMPIGVSGEIHIGGAGVARGYLNRPELTAERFLKDPFSPAPEARMYKTGDLGRWLPDGTIEFLGRNDYQVKIRGFRIELGEIEAQLTACAGVREAVVVAREDEAGDKRLVAYLLAEAGTALSAVELRADLSSRLPDYMVPSAFVQLEAFPLTPNGKLDRRALPAPDEASVASREYEAPQGEIEETLAGIWQELLGVERVGRRDNFFELGGHSLLAVTLVERLRESGWGMAMPTIFTAPTLHALATTLSRKSSTAESLIPENLIGLDTTEITPDLLPLVSLTQEEIDRIVASVPGGIANIQDVYPSLPMQEGMLFHHLLEEKGDTYLSRDVLAFDSRERLDAFVAALNQVIARHDILRTAMLWEGRLSKPVQVVYREAPLPVHEVALPETSAATEALHRQVDPRQMRLDVRRAPLLAAYVTEDHEHGEWLLALLHHHVVCDHVTLELALTEVEAVLRDASASLPTALPFRNVVAQARQTPIAEHEAYFRQELGEIDESTAPFGVLDVQHSSTEVSESVMPLDVELSRRIRACARREGISRAVLFHVAWAQVLARCTGREEVVFGTVLSGRMQGLSGLDRVLGMTINTLPLRVSLGERSVRRVVQESAQRMQALVAHEQAPLALAQRCSSVSPSMPLFTTLLNYRHGDVRADGGFFSLVEGVRLFPVKEFTNYPIVVAVDDIDAGFIVRSQCTSMISASRLNHYLLTALTGLVEALSEDAETPLCKVDVLPSSERAQLVEEFNATAAEYPREALIHELFEAQAAQQPEALAVVYEDRRLTYGELNARANQLAHYLMGRGVKPDDRVAICVERNLEMVVGLLGILKAGGAYVPLDPAYPAERLAYMLEDSAPVALLTQADAAAHLAALEVPVLELDAAETCGLLAEQSTGNPDARAGGLTSGHLAYVIYTSGSTGMPKGVMVEHRSVVKLANSGDYIKLDVDTVVAQASNVSFDAATFEIWGVLANGGKLVVVKKDVLIHPERLQEIIDNENIDALFVTTALFNCIAQSNPSSLMGLDTLLFGGEAVSPQAVTMVIENGMPNRLVHVYGPTENTTFSTWFQVAGLTPGITVPIGRPIANTQIYILDRHGEPVPLGVPGEIHIGGAGVARGYLNRPELTAERFLKDPFSPVPEARMYKTGDLGRWLPDGTIEFLGRNDYQVKIRGFRIELGEIEARLAACAGVREAVVVAREDEAGDKRLVAYLLAEADTALSAVELRADLSSRLPDYMVPSAFVQLEAFPLTPNGKLDRRALPAPDEASVASREYEAPQGEIEEALAGIWQELLGVERVGRRDNFFELGGHSLLAVTLVAHVRDVLQVEVPLRELFARPTLRALAKHVEQQGQLCELRRVLIAGHAKNNDEIVVEI
ncbi:non-ribosomal peptide synthetase [Xanthomonas sp. GW]|nr:non-ribosomal peptide synthetase [Xanthomonas sp. GW]